MADWAQPTTASLYTDVLAILKARDVDAYTLADGTATTPPTGAMRYVRASNKFQEWNGTAWVDKTISIAGGGTGSTTASGARTNLGLGTMATQNANGVAITGGTLSGITALTLATDLAFDADGTRKVGSNANKANNVYIKNGLLIPVGADKWVSS